MFSMDATDTSFVAPRSAVVGVQHEMRLTVYLLQRTEGLNPETWI